MKKSIFVVLIILFVSSCSEKHAESSSTTTQENKTQIEIINYYPEIIETIIEDTTIQDSIRLILETKNSEIDFITKSWELNSDTLMHDRYRDNIVNFKLTVHDSLVFASEIKKELLVQTMPVEFMKEAKIFLAWSDSYEKESNEIKSRMTVCVPESDYCYLYNIYLSTKGSLRIEMEEIT